MGAVSRQVSGRIQLKTDNGQPTTSIAKLTTDN
jgi:hypothetical protein